MTAFHPLVPSKAIEMIEAAGIQHAQRLIRDHAAAGLVKSYASLIKTIPIAGGAVCVRDSTIPTSLWDRIVQEAADDDVWTGGTVRLAAGELIGGKPAVEITGVGFKAGDLQRLIDQHCGVTGEAKPKRASKAASPAAAPEAGEPAPEPKQKRQRAAPDLSSLHAGALHLTVEQTKAALSISHTTLYKLLKLGELERAPSKAGTRIMASSVRRYADIAF